MDKRYIVETETDGNRIKDVRKKLGLTQKEFAELIGCSKPTVERWEISDRKIKGLIAFVVAMLERHPEFLEELRLPQREYPRRLYYMYKEKVCTVIDVDELNQKVKIINYVDNIMFRAFGTNNNPTYEEYERFLESRCFPRERDKIKIYLKELDIPFYDPMLIIEKTEGRMEEDDFWIKVEK
ncbi:MAG: type II toxin-antitoxin system MqsA family antitoxin [Acetatifactor sp.]|nr:type II toxin-antitoxin system MqsA family antitoxin [Acetatifactor sp.]